MIDYKLATTLFSERKILYVHGFASSGQSTTPQNLKILMPEAKIIAPDLPIEPFEAMDLLNDIITKEKPSLIIGTSMGGMYAQMLYNVDRILVNPAFEIAATMISNNMVGKVNFFNPRKDGATDFIVTKSLVQRYKEVSEQCFKQVSSDKALVYGLFGKHDPMVHTFDVFNKYYNNAIYFEGEHRLDEHVILHSLLPIIRWIDDKQTCKEKEILYLRMEDTLFNDSEPQSDAVKCVEFLTNFYKVYFLCEGRTNSRQEILNKYNLIEKYFGVNAYDRVVFANNCATLYGDYLISASKTNNEENFLGTFLNFKQEPLKTWSEVITYFKRLNGIEV